MDAAKKLEDKLKNQHTKVADADRTLAEAVLKAHANSVDSQKKLASLKQEIEDAVKNQTTLDTPMGAREFSKFLLQKQQEILAIATDANLDDKDKQAILAGLGYLNSAAVDDPNNQSNGQTQGNNQGNGQSEGNNQGSNQGNGQASAGDPNANLGPGNDANPGGDPLASLLGGDPLGAGGLGDGSGGPLSGLSGLTSGLGGMVPQLGGGGLGGGGLPGLFGGGGDSGNSGGGGSSLGDLLGGDKPSHDHHRDDLGDNPLDPSKPGDPTTDKPGQSTDPNNPDHPGGKPGDKPNNDNPTPTPGAPVPGQLAPPTPPGTGPTPVTLPNGTTVTSPNPQLANVAKLVAGGTPIADAFHQNGINWPPPPGTAVHTPMDPSKITTGYVGQFADHQVFAFDKNWVWINGQLHPIADASGPGFLGWMAPPDVPPAPTTAAPVVTTAATAPAPAPAAPAVPLAPAAAPAAGQTESNLLIPASHK